MDDLGAYEGIGIREAYEDLDKAEALAGDSINMKHPDYGAGATDSFMLLESDWEPPWQMTTVPWHEKGVDDAVLRNGRQAQQNVWQSISMGMRLQHWWHPCNDLYVTVGVCGHEIMAGSFGVTLALTQDKETGVHGNG